MGHNTTASHLIKVIRQSFCRTGVPDTFWSDKGPQFTSKQFQDLTREWGFWHSMSSPRYSQSNGKIESTVKSMKKLTQTSWNNHSLDEDKLACALLQYCNTPSRKDGLSPAQKLFGKPIQDTTSPPLDILQQVAAKYRRYPWRIKRKQSYITTTMHAASPRFTSDQMSLSIMG